MREDVFDLSEKCDGRCPRLWDGSQRSACPLAAWAGLVPAGSGRQGRTAVGGHFAVPLRWTLADLKLPFAPCREASRLRCRLGGHRSPSRAGTISSWR
jgi:hypothetical protein